MDKLEQKSQVTFRTRVRDDILMDSPLLLKDRTLIIILVVTDVATKDDFLPTCGIYHQVLKTMHKIFMIKVLMIFTVFV